MPPGVRRDRVRAVGSGFSENAEASGVRRRSRKNANDPKSDSGDHPAQHDCQCLSMPAALKEKLKPILAPEGLTEDPVAISESVASCDHRR